MLCKLRIVPSIFLATAAVFLILGNSVGALAPTTTTIKGTAFKPDGTTQLKTGGVISVFDSKNNPITPTSGSANISTVDGSFSFTYTKDFATFPDKTIRIEFKKTSTSAVSRTIKNIKGDVATIDFDVIVP